MAPVLSKCNCFFLFVLENKIEIKVHGEGTPQKIFIKEAIIEAFSDKSKIDESKKLKILENLELYIPELT